MVEYTGTINNIGLFSVIVNWGPIIEENLYDKKDVFHLLLLIYGEIVYSLYKIKNLFIRKAFFNIFLLIYNYVTTYLFICQ